MDKILSDIYFNTKTGFTGVDELLRRARKKDSSVTKKHVQQWLEKQYTYTLHKPARRHYARNKTIVSGIDAQWQLDLVDLSSLSAENDNVKFLLMVIDIFSKFAWCRPMKDKSANSIVFAFKKILESGRKPLIIQSDAGTEFLNKKFQSLLQELDIKFFVTNSEVKASVVERLNRTVKDKMWRWFSQSGTQRYIDELDNLMKSYNSSYHRTIKLAPIEVNTSNENEILTRVFSVPNAKNIKFKFSIGDTVRLNKVKKLFDKGHKAGWTEETFLITARIARRPPVYKIADQMKSEIKGVFYEPELERIHPSATSAVGAGIYIVERVLKTRKRNGVTEYFVLWRGFPKEHASWTTDLIKL